MLPCHATKPHGIEFLRQRLGYAGSEVISAVGDDLLGQELLRAMAAWGMETTAVQIDRHHPTGKVEERIVDREPHYQILPDCAYVLIAGESLPPLADGILYHGSLALRGETARSALRQLAAHPRVAIFLDVNLHAPWWRRDEVLHWLQQARWAKLDQEELRLLGFCSGDLRQDATQLLRKPT